MANHTARQAEDKYQASRYANKPAHLRSSTGFTRPCLMPEVFETQQRYPDWEYIAPPQQGSTDFHHHNMLND